ncbi:penicillin-binding protein A [Clostridium acetireducens DSM 10703]|jgi:peptidoglycan glycosyltransferase|uniref:Penicillin-binding protein A n=1 Tax=Clostridium acetireducens DSM 10703 TaxID=1121290 RepID=A0A1E8F1I8_9CLOT|nr:penicillin-binding protein 2 [Clostridium acetireducens]OFI07495.1 penicillin-binding protein A [Clostridium acetireducens DSM 10703]
MNDISNNIKRVLIVFLVCFLGLILYITYFEFFVGPKIVSSQYNRRLWVKRNEVLRGTIYDRKMKPLTKSERLNKEFQKREYVDGEMFAHVLGYVNIKYGITGLEKKYDNELMTTNIKDSLLDFIKSKGKEEPKIGNSIKSTLNYKVQQKAFELLGDNKGAVVVIEPKTGEILALVSKPSYNPNKLDDIWSSINKDNDRPLINRATAGLYPPGSTFKVLTAVSALQNIDGIMNRTFQDNGTLVFNSTQSLSNFNGESFGSINFRQSFVHSSNVVFGSLGLELGNSRLKDTAEKFFFNKNIPSDDIVIENSKFPTLKSYEKGNIAQSAIGQATVLSTPMEMALITSTIANDGVMMKPKLVKEILSYKGERVQDLEPEQIGKIMTNDESRIIKEFMREVVRSGTGRGASVEGVEVCGKTGTADHREGGYAPPHSWFIGFAPYDNPKVAVAVIVEEGGQGGIAAARIASEVIRTALNE